jgi:hypothetical protein
MNYDENSVPLLGRTNDDFTLYIDIGEAIDSRIPKMFIGSVDMSSYLTITGDSTFILHIDASKMALLGVGTFQYDIILEIDADNNKFLFGGIFTINKGVTP